MTAIMTPPQDLEKLNTGTLTFRRYTADRVNMIHTYPLGDSGEYASQSYRFTEELSVKLDRQLEQTFIDGAGRTIRTGVYVNGERHGFSVAWPQH